MSQGAAASSYDRGAHCRVCAFPDFRNKPCSTNLTRTEIQRMLQPCERSHRLSWSPTIRETSMIAYKSIFERENKHAQGVTRLVSGAS